MVNTKEEWVSLEEFPRYKISSLGRVYNKETNKFLKGANDGKGYWHYCLRDANGKQRAVFAHRLVAKGFLPNTQNKPEVNHIDGNKLNNRVDNLEWVTGQENHHHKMINGLNVTQKGERHGRAKLRDSEVEEIFLLILKSNLTQREIAKMYNTNPTTVNHIKTGRQWKSVTDKIKERLK